MNFFKQQVYIIELSTNEKKERKKKHLLNCVSLKLFVSRLFWSRNFSLPINIFCCCCGFFPIHFCGLNRWPTLNNNFQLIFVIQLDWVVLDTCNLNRFQIFILSSPTLQCTQVHDTLFEINASKIKLIFRWNTKEK